MFGNFCWRQKRGLFSSVLAFLKAHSGATCLKKGEEWRKKNRFGASKKFPNTLLSWRSNFDFGDALQASSSSAGPKCSKPPITHNLLMSVCKATSIVHKSPTSAKKTTQRQKRNQNEPLQNPEPTRGNSSCRNHPGIAGTSMIKSPLPLVNVMFR